MPEPQHDQHACEQCKNMGTVGVDVHPFNVAKGVTAWLHRSCKPAHDDERRAQG